MPEGPTSDGAERTLSEAERPDFERGGSQTIAVVDLFSGCGGLTLGAAQAAHAAGHGFAIKLAIDFDDSPMAVYRNNFPGALDTRVADVTSIFAPDLESAISTSELHLSAQIGDVDVLLGGPPCQGHSNLNNHTRGNDPKNALYLSMARAAAILRPRIVLIENVPSVLNDKFEGRNVASVVRANLQEQGYDVMDEVVSIAKLGVAQLRKRHVLLAARDSTISPLQAFERARALSQSRDLRWAIGDLIDAPNEGFDSRPLASRSNLARMEYLQSTGEFDLPNHLRPKCHQGTHSYKSMYGRLDWSKPAQTITSGYGSIGQGRYMHPQEIRALTAHEAARIQGFPDYFDFAGVSRRGDLATIIGNAAPPQLSQTLLDALI